MARWLRKLIYVLQVPAAAACYLLALGQYETGGSFFSVINEPGTLAFLLLALAWLALESLILLPLVGEPPIFGEFSGLSFSPRRWLVLGLGWLPELVACLEHGQMRLIPLGEPPRWVGLAMLAAGLAIALVADVCLRRHFREPGRLAARLPPQAGPYRHIRHPRMAGFLLGKMGTALALASGVGLLCLIPYILILPAVIRHEERHLLRTFGDEFRFYRARTARLIPWLY